MGNSTRRTFRVLVALVVAVAMAATACGGGSDGSNTAAGDALASGAETAAIDGQTREGAADDPLRNDLIRPDVPTIAYEFFPDSSAVTVSLTGMNRVQNAGNVHLYHSEIGIEYVTLNDEGISLAGSETGACGCTVFTFSAPLDLEHPGTHSVRLNLLDEGLGGLMAAVPQRSTVSRLEGNVVYGPGSASERRAVTVDGVTVDTVDTNNDGEWEAYFDSATDVSTASYIAVRVYGSPFLEPDPRTNTWSHTVIRDEPEPQQVATIAVTDKPAGTSDRAVMSGLSPGQSSRVTVLEPSGDGSIFTEVFQRDCDPAAANGQESCPINNVVAGNKVTVEVLDGSSWMLTTEIVIPADVEPGDTYTSAEGNSFTVEIAPGANVNPDSSGPYVNLALRSDGQVRASGLQFDPHSVARLTVRRSGSHLGNHFGIAGADGRVNTSNWNLSVSEMTEGDSVGVYQRRVDGPGGSYIEPDWVLVYEFTYDGTAA